VKGTAFKLEDFILDFKLYNTSGLEKQPPIKLSKEFLIVIRMQVKNVISPIDSANLGSVVYANSYFAIDEDTHLNVTDHIPNFQAWYTTHKHFENLSSLI